MSAENGNAGWGSVLRGLLHMRICELRTRASLIRLVVTFCLVFGLVVLAGRNSDADDLGFWRVAIEVFAFGFLPLFCLVRGGETLRNELKEGTIEYLWTRPTRKAPLFVGFFLSSLLGIGAILGSCVLAICAAGVWLGAVESIGQVALYACGCFLLGTAFASVASGLGAFTSKFVVFGILYFSFVERLLALMPTSVRNLSVISHGRELFAPLLEGRAGLLTMQSLQSGIGIAIIAGVALVAGATLFTTRTYVVGGEN